MRGKSVGADLAGPKNCGTRQSFVRVGTVKVRLRRASELQQGEVSTLSVRPRPRVCTDSSSKASRQDTDFQSHYPSSGAELAIV